MEQGASPKKPLLKAKRVETVQQPSSPTPDTPGPVETFWLATDPTTEEASSPPMFGSYHERLKFATLLFLVSLFLNWGVSYWGMWYVHLVWDPGYIEALPPMNGWSEMIDFLDLMFVQVWMMDQYRYMFEESGVFPLLLIVLRDLMPFVFIGTLVVGWVKRDSPPAFFEKLGTFIAGYAGLMGATMAYITLSMTASHGGIELFFEMLGGALGFWMAVAAGLVLHPTLVNETKLRFKPSSSSIIDDDTLNESEESISPEAEDALEVHTMVLFYLPFLYLYSVVISVNRGGDDDALFMGTVLPITGFLIGLYRYRMAFFEGFVVNLGFCIPIGFAFGFAGVLGVFGDVNNLEAVLWLAILPTLYLPYKHHKEQRHRRALGAAYAAPLCVMAIVFCLMVGVITKYGLF